MTRLRGKVVERYQSGLDLSEIFQYVSNDEEDHYGRNCQGEIEHKDLIGVGYVLVGFGRKYLVIKLFYKSLQCCSII